MICSALRRSPLRSSGVDGGSPPLPTLLSPRISA